MKQFRLKHLLLLLAAAFCVAPLAAVAQPADKFPTRPVRMIVPYAPGGATDIVARQVAQRLSELWGYQVVVDNRAGGSGAIALETVARATPDGYTLMVGNVSTNAIAETAFAKTLAIKPSRDLTAVTNLIEIPHMFLASTAVQATNLRQLAEYAKSAPRMAYASAGIASYPHLDAARLLKAMGIEMTHIPYKGGAGQMIPAMISNETQFTMLNLASTLPHIRAGRLKPLATTWPTRRSEFPEVQTMAEAGYPGIGTNAWNGLFAPSKMPPALLAHIYASTLKVLDSPEMKEALGKQLISVVPSKSPADYARFVNEDVVKWAAVIRENNISLD
jgi:tripartite-type tricarboxylate transporter receptor subunit TctC